MRIDQWEVDRDLLSLDEELGEGAFGKVYKGTVKELRTPSGKLAMMPSMSAPRKTRLKRSEAFTVAVKMLHGELSLVMFHYYSKAIPMALINSGRWATGHEHDRMDWRMRE